MLQICLTGILFAFPSDSCVRKHRLLPHHLIHSLPQGTISWLLGCKHLRRKYRGEQLSAVRKMPPVSPQLSLSFYLADSFSVELHKLLHCRQCVDLWPLPSFFRQTVLNVPQGSSQHHGYQWQDVVLHHHAGQLEEGSELMTFQWFLLCFAQNL